MKNVSTAEGMHCRQLQRRNATTALDYINLEREQRNDGKNPMKRQRWNRNDAFIEPLPCALHATRPLRFNPLERKVYTVLSRETNALAFFSSKGIRLF